LPAKENYSNKKSLSYYFKLLIL